MAKQTNTPNDWRILAERDIVVADHLANNMAPVPTFVSISSLCTIITHFSIQPRYDLGISLSEADMRLVLAHTKTIRDFLQKEIPALFQ